VIGGRVDNGIRHNGFGFDSVYTS